ncbi:MAG TPA: TlpA disulfide reductase family protein [Symbiobacteriaceae bacterium]|nr:TlpA disulfide reductase family protein [Symbiobacteriaceae bacterium]
MRRTLLLLVTVLLLAACSRPVGQEVAPGAPVQIKVAEGFRAPEITAIDVQTGQSVTLSDLRGQPVFLNFWATWCGPCKIEMPAMEDLYREAGPKLRILAVGQTPWETKEQLAAFAKERGLTFPILFDGGAAAEAYGIVGVPTSIFIDGDGIIRALHPGTLSGEKMRALAATAGYK